MRAALVRRKFAAMSGERILEVLASPRRRYRSEAIEIAVAELDSRGKHLLLESPPFRPFTAFPFICPNCENVFEEPKVFCSEQCQQVAIFVRDHRRYIDDGRFEQPDFQQLFYDRFVLLMSGYSPSARRVPKRIRAAVIARDGGRCRKCGAPTNIIDHIQGNSQELSNLQVLCDACNWAKARERYVPIPRESLAKETAKRDAVIGRIWRRHPERLCDDHVIWKHLSLRILRIRRRIVDDRKKRRSGIHCPVCLAELPRRTLVDYRKTGERRERWCAKCLAKRLYEPPCSICGAKAVWINATMWACQACHGYGTL